jgi:hypothetical protein
MAHKDLLLLLMMMMMIFPLKYKRRKQVYLPGPLIATINVNVACSYFHNIYSTAKNVKPVLACNTLDPVYIYPASIQQ